MKNVKNIKKMFLCHAIPGSGKSTLAKQLCQDNQPCVILSTDQVQSDENGVYLYSSDYFGLAHKINIAKTKEACKRGLNIVVDNTNLVAKDCKPYFDLATEYGYEFQLVEPTTEWANDVNECFKRNTHGVPIEVLERMKKKCQSIDRIMDQLRRNEIVPVVPDKVEYIENLPWCVICDLDGTLATLHRDPYDTEKCETDTLNEQVSNLLSMMKTDGKKIILMSGREDKFRPHTEKWLKTNAVEYDCLYMRKAGDFRRDSIIKRELYYKYIQNQYNVSFVLDDRFQVQKECWFPLGLWVFNCNQELRDF